MTKSNDSTSKAASAAPTKPATRNSGRAALRKRQLAEMKALRKTQAAAAEVKARAARRRHKSMGDARGKPEMVQTESNEK